MPAGLQPIGPAGQRPGYRRTWAGRPRLSGRHDQVRQSDHEPLRGGDGRPGSSRRPGRRAVTARRSTGRCTAFCVWSWRPLTTSRTPAHSEVVNADRPGHDRRRRRVCGS